MVLLLRYDSGYWQVELDDRKKTAFIGRKGLFEFKVLPFGLCNVPGTFERLIEIVLAGLHLETCLVYLDDIIVCGKTFEDMVKNIDEVLDRLREAGLKLKARKCQLFVKRVDFLGRWYKHRPQENRMCSKLARPYNHERSQIFSGLL